MQKKPSRFCFLIFLFVSYQFQKNSVFAEEVQSKKTKESILYDHYQMTQKDSFKIKFLGKITPGGSFEGQAIKASGKILIDSIKKEIISGKFSVPIKSLTTGNNVRDRHMMEKYLEVNKKGMPSDIVLTVKSSSYQSLREKKVLIPVIWQIHGQEKESTIPLEDIKLPQKEGGKISISTKLKLNLKDFLIEVPSYLVVWMNEEVEVFVDLEISYEGKKEKIENHEKI
jgi:polyisoprenoid-binding protein YceI